MLVHLNVSPHQEKTMNEVEVAMQFTNTNLVDVILVEPRVFEDDRGYFFESYHKKLFDEQGISLEFVQDNHSRSKQGTLRGLHYQIRQAQGKLVRVFLGEVYDVAVDLRKSSPSFGQWVGHLLSAENKRQLYIPPGFAHGFYVVSEWADVVYKTTDYYAPQWERTLLWNDPQLNIPWPLLGGGQLLISPKDTIGIPLGQAEVYE
jgi:dTDP-4-dehydrorhamnose 3,5-epimerase